MFQFLSNVHSICFWGRFSFSTWLLALYFAWVAGCFVARAPLCLSAFLHSSWSSRLPHSRLPPSSWILLRFLSFTPPLFCLAFSLLPFTFPLVFHPDVSASAFPSCCLLSSRALLFFLCEGGIGRLAWLFPCSSSTVLGLPSSLSLSFRFVTSLHSLVALLTRSHLRFTPRRGLPLGRVCSCLASFHSSFASLRRPIDLSLCLHPLGSLPLLLQSAVHYLYYFLSSRGFSFLPLACSWSPSCVRCPSRFPICYFP